MEVPNESKPKLSGITMGFIEFFPKMCKIGEYLGLFVWGGT